MKFRNILTGRSTTTMPAYKGGNWQGLEYLTYAEHDQCTRHALNFGYKSRALHGALYELEKRAIIAARNL